MAKFEESRYAHEMSRTGVMSFVRMRDARLARKPVVDSGDCSAHSDPRPNFTKSVKKNSS
jgi:hypothetical protein